MIHVCFGLYDKTGRYSKLTGTAMLSIFENATAAERSITVHLLCDNTLTAENRDNFSELAKRYNQFVKFYNVEELCAEKLEEYVNLIPKIKNAAVSTGAFYRLLIPDIMAQDIKKVIYLDSDLIIHLDITELWKVELGDKAVAAVPSYLQNSGQKALHRVKYSQLCQMGLVQPRDYFGSGVLIINVEVWSSYWKEFVSVANTPNFLSSTRKFSITAFRHVASNCP